MWKVVITEIQDANAIEPLEVPPGAFFVSTERFARTVENLDLQSLINAIERMQSPQGFGLEGTRIPGERVLRRSGSASRSPALCGTHSASLERSLSITLAE